jgi:hypothetical protein
MRDPEVFFRDDEDPSDFDSFERYSYVDEQPPFILGERVIPNATRSGHAIVRNTRVWEADEFQGGNAQDAAKIAFRRFMERRNAHRS